VFCFECQWHAGFVGIDEAGCTDKGCCWSPVQAGTAAHQNEAWCFYPNADISEYELVTTKDTGKPAGHVHLRIESMQRTQHHLPIRLKLLGLPDILSFILQTMQSAANAQMLLIVAAP